MKDPLEYSEEELNQLSDDELEQLVSTCNTKESLYNTRQLVEKVTINSLSSAKNT